MAVVQQRRPQKLKFSHFWIFLLILFALISFFAVFFAKHLFSEDGLQIELPTAAARKIKHIDPLLTYLPFQSIPYTVNEQDTLSSLARRYVTSEASIKLLNNNTSSFIRNGEKLLLPNQPGVIHAVSSGESLLQIAHRYNTPLAKILDVNKLTTAILQPNSLLFIPQQPTQPLRQKESFFAPLQHSDSFPNSQLVNNYFFERSATALIIPARYNQTVYAISSGKVTQFGYHPRLGRYILLEQQDFFVLYAYLTAIEVEKGQKITAKQALAKVGKQFEQQDSALLYFSLIRGEHALRLGSYPESLQEILARLRASASSNKPPLDAGWKKLLF